MIYVVVTGASRGIGREIAKIFAVHNFGLILTCEKNIALLEELKIELIGKTKLNENEIHIVKGNLNKEIINKIISHNDQIYILINNASKDYYKLLQDLTLREWNDIINSNLTTMFENTKAVLDNMIHNKNGIILNISSMWGLLGASNEVAYSTTKGGVIAFTKALAKELMPNNIDVFSIALGAVDTDMNSNLTKEEKIEFEKTLTDGKMFSKEYVAEKIYEIIQKKLYKTSDIIEMNNGLK